MISKYFRPHQKAKLAFSNSSGLKSVFEKLRYGRPNRRNKAAFSNSSGVVWTRDLRHEGDAKRGRTCVSNLTHDCARFYFLPYDKKYHENYSELAPLCTGQPRMGQFGIIFCSLKSTFFASVIQHMQSSVNQVYFNCQGRCQIARVISLARYRSLTFSTVYKSYTNFLKLINYPSSLDKRN